MTGFELNCQREMIITDYSIGIHTPRFHCGGDGDSFTMFDSLLIAAVKFLWHVFIMMGTNVRPSDTWTDV